MWFMILFPPAVAAYGWVCEEHVNVAAICVTLFFAGFFSMCVCYCTRSPPELTPPFRCIYSSTLAYIVDANTGRSSSAVACNSCFRGGSAFVAAEIAVPLQVRLVYLLPIAANLQFV